MWLGKNHSETCNLASPQVSSVADYSRRLPEVGYLRLKQVLSIFPVGKSTWWEGVRSGRFPKPVRLSARTSAWRVEDIRALIERTAGVAK